MAFNPLSSDVLKSVRTPMTGKSLPQPFLYPISRQAKMIKVFLDSSVVFAAAGSQTGGSFEIINLIKKGRLESLVNEGVVAESEEAIRRKLSLEKYKLFINWLE